MDQGSMLDLDLRESSMGRNPDRLAVCGQMHGFELHPVSLMNSRSPSTVASQLLEAWSKILFECETRVFRHAEIR
jgi:hypothetical protein